MNVRPATMTFALLAAFALSGCASPDGDVPDPFDASLGEVVLVFAGDGFVQCDAQRTPLDACILRLRQRLRTMDRAQRAAFVVTVQAEPGIADPAVVLRAQAEMNRAVDELFVMGVRQVRFQ